MTYTPRPDASDSERLAVVEAAVCDLHSRLLGNGQPGELIRIGERVEKLERWKWQLSGGLGLGVVAVECLAHLKSLFHP